MKTSAVTSFVRVSAVLRCRRSCFVRRMTRMLSLAAWLCRQWMSPVSTPWQRRWRSSIAQSRVRSWSGQRGCSAPPRQNWLRCRRTARRRTVLSTAGHRRSVRTQSAWMLEWRGAIGIHNALYSAYVNFHGRRRLCGKRQGVGWHWRRPARLRWSRRAGADRVRRTAGVQTVSYNCT